MAGALSMSGGSGKRYAGHATTYVVVACIVAASGGALMGYDNGVTGGVVAMPGFLEQFFPEVAERVKAIARSEEDGLELDPYCTFDDQGLQWFTSSLFLAGMAASLPSGWYCRKYGRKSSMLIAGLMFDLGILLISAAWNFAMLLTGRLLLGAAVALAAVAVTLYNSEMAPAHLRGVLNQLFQVVLGLGVLLAQLVNLVTQHIYPSGWRISLAVAAVPALVLTLGGIYLPDTPASLFERGKEAEGRKVLQDIRGVSDVDEEFADIAAASKQASLVKSPWRTLMSRPYRPQLVVALSATFWQQASGINTLTFYSPQLFITLGTGAEQALAAVIVIGVVGHLSGYVAVWAADIYGRRILWIQGGVQMFVALVAIASVLATNGAEPWVPWFVLVGMCIYVAAYAWSWGPLAWLYPSEVQPLETRSAGQSLATLINLTFSFVIGQTYLSLLCAMRWGIFLFFAGLIVLMTIFVYFLYPETKGLGMEEAPKIFRKHWYWKRYANQTDEHTAHDDMRTRDKPAASPHRVRPSNRFNNSGIELKPLMRKSSTEERAQSEHPTHVTQSSEVVSTSSHQQDPPDILQAGRQSSADGSSQMEDNHQSLEGGAGSGKPSPV